MAENGLKMVEIFLGASHMTNNNIFYLFFVLLLFSLGTFLALFLELFSLNLAKIQGL